MIAVPAGSALIWMIPVVVGMAAALVLTPLARALAVVTGTIDRPVGGKIHAQPTPLMGGLAVFAAFVFGALATLHATPAVTGVLVGGCVAVTVGILDERLNLPPPVHLAGQFTAAAAAIVGGLGVVHSVSVPFEGLTDRGLTLPLWLGALFTVFWLVGMMNTMNFLDGLDGLVAGVGTLAALLLAVWAAEPSRFYLPATSHHEDLILPLALAGALIGFLPYNWHVARIFLGDSGSMFVGLAIGALSIVGPAKLGTALLVLLIPVLDVAWAIVRRWRSGHSPIKGDKQHVYHRMLQLGMRHTTIVLLLYFVCLDLAILDWLLVKLAKLVAFVVLALISMAAFLVLEARASQPDRHAADAVTRGARLQ